MIKAVIFDLDGTLADTLASIAHCTNRALADAGFAPIEEERFRLMVGNGARMQLSRALRIAGDAEGSAVFEADSDGFLTRPVHLDAVTERYMQYFKTDCLYQVKPYDGIRDLLQSLKGRGIKTAVLSNKPHENTRYVIDSLFGDDCFAVVQGQTPAIPKKPAPEGVLEILRRLKLQRDEILYVGDSGVDMDTGRAAGVKTIGVLWGFRDGRELLAHGADGLIGKPKELLCYL